MAEKSFLDKIKQTNQRLKAAKLGVSILQRGNRLYLRGTLPPKPNASKIADHQQDIALKVYANPQGLQQAEKEAKKIGAALALKQFDWFEYLPPITPQPDRKLVADCITAFEADYFQRRLRRAETESTWRVNYSTYFRRLPQDQPLTLEVLEKVILTTIPDSFPRLGICYAFAKLAEFMGLDVKPINRLKGSYLQKPKTPRNLPSDEEVIKWFNQISDPAWRWAYGMLAAYGLRPHEVFYLDTQELENGGVAISVLPGTKTGSRRVYPLYREWIDLFNLREKKILKLQGKNFSQIGNQLSNHFRAAGIPFPPYNLRHAWAVRACQLKIDVTLAARWMGHGVNIHTKTYQKWMSAEIEQRMYEQIIQVQEVNPSRIVGNQSLLEIQPQPTVPLEPTDCTCLPAIEAQAEQGTVVLRPLEAQLLPDVPAAIPNKKKRNAPVETNSEFQQLDLLAG